MNKRNLLVGIGSSHGRDQVGWQVATALKQRPPRNCDVRIALAPADILDWFQGYQAVHICDACSGSATEPAIHRWSWPDAQVDDQAWGGTHDLSLPAVLHIATALGIAPVEIVLWGIEVPERDCSAEDLPAIVKMVAMAADRIYLELQSTAERCSHA